MKYSRGEDKEDVLGLVFWDYYFRHKKSLTITERNDGFIEAEDPHIWFSKYDEWLDVERRAMGCVKGKRVLDIGGCGTGRHALYLQKERGFDVLGIDRSPLAIKVCKLQGLKKAKVQSVTQFTLNAVRKDYSFDTILMLGNNFGLFETLRRARWLLRKFHKMTSDDAAIIAQSVDPYNKPHEYAHLRYYKINRMKGRMPGQTRMRIRYKSYKGRWFDYLFVSHREMKSIVNGTGVWKINHFLNSTDVPEVYIAIIAKDAVMQRHL